MTKNSIFKIINQTFVYIFCLIISLIVLYPLVYVVSAAFSPGRGIASVNIIPFGDGFLAVFNMIWFQGL